MRDSLKLAKKLGFSFYFDWEATRTPEGYYKVEGCVDFCVRRGVKFSPYADVLWMETASADYDIAKEFAEGIHKTVPHQMLGYN